MKVKLYTVLYLLVISLFIGCNEVNNKINESLNENEIEGNKEKDEFEGTLMVVNEEELAIALKEDYSTIIDKKVAFNLNIIRKSILSILKVIDVGKKYSLKNKIHYINDNFESFFPRIIEQLSSQVSN